MSKTINISNRSFKPDYFLGIKCSHPSEESYIETTTYICEICKKSDEKRVEITHLLHTGHELRYPRNTPSIYFREVVWGYKSHSFYACETHSELELDKKVNKLKKIEHAKYLKDAEDDE